MLGLTPTEFGLFDPGELNAFAYWNHLLVGSLGLGGALVALMVRKGGLVHRIAGYLFLTGILVAALSAISFSFTRFALPPIVSSLVAIIAAATAWLALKKKTSTVARWEKTLRWALLAITVAFTLAGSFAVSQGVAPPMVLISLLILPYMLVAGDFYYFRHYDRRREWRFVRHVSRMAIVLAIGVRAPLFELIDDLEIFPPLVLFLPLLIPPLVLLIFGRRALRMGGNTNFAG